MAHATDRLEIRLTPADKATLADAAMKSHLPLSAFVRRAVLDRAEAVLSLSRSYTAVSNLVFEQLRGELGNQPAPVAALRCGAARLAEGVVEVIPLRDHHLRDLWKSGDDDHDDWLRDAKPADGTCWVWAGWHGDVQAYYALEPHQIVRAGTVATAESGIQAVLIRRLAVSRSRQRMDIGGALLADALRRAISARDVTGSAFVVIEALSPDARGFCEHHGFRDLPGTTRMAIRTEDAAASLSAR